MSKSNKKSLIQPSLSQWLAKNTVHRTHPSTGTPITSKQSQDNTIINYGNSNTRSTDISSTSIQSSLITPNYVLMIPCRIPSNSPTSNINHMPVKNSKSRKSKTKNTGLPHHDLKYENHDVFDQIVTHHTSIDELNNSQIVGCTSFSEQQTSSPMNEIKPSPVISTVDASTSIQNRDYESKKRDKRSRRSSVQHHVSEDIECDERDWFEKKKKETCTRIKAQHIANHLCNQQIPEKYGRYQYSQDKETELHQRLVLYKTWLTHEQHVRHVHIFIQPHQLETRPHINITQNDNILYKYAQDVAQYSNHDVWLACSNINSQQTPSSHMIEQWTDMTLRGLYRIDPRTLYERQDIRDCIQNIVQYCSFQHVLTVMNYKQRSEDWHRIRKGFAENQKNLYIAPLITGSICGSICNHDKYKLDYLVLQQLLWPELKPMPTLSLPHVDHHQQQEQEQKHESHIENNLKETFNKNKRDDVSAIVALSRGTAYEPMVMKYTEMILRNQLKRTKPHAHLWIEEVNLVLCKQRPYMGASPDGLIYIYDPIEDYLECQGLEMKVRAKNTDHPYPQVPHSYYDQCQQAMYILGLKTYKFVCYTPHQIKIQSFHYNEAYWLHCLKIIERFYFSKLYPVYLLREKYKRTIPTGHVSLTLHDEFQPIIDYYTQLLNNHRNISDNETNTQVNNNVLRYNQTIHSCANPPIQSQNYTLFNNMLIDDYLIHVLDNKCFSFC